MKIRGSLGSFATGGRAAGATSWLLVLFAAVLLGAPSPTVAPHPDEDKPHGPLTQPRGCWKKCNKLKLGYFINKLTDTRASGPQNILGNYNYERYVLDPAAATVLGSLETSGHGSELVECCQKCAKQVGCRFWHLKPPMNGQLGQCTLLGSLAGITVRNWDVPIVPTFLGGECNPLANTDDDPHFRGADGTRYDFNGLLDRSFCLVSDRRIHVNMGIKGYQPVANLPGTATSLDEESLAAAVEAAANEKKPRHIRQLEEERLSAEELSELDRMRANGSLPLTDEVVAALDRETGRSSEEGGESGRKQDSIQYSKHELKARLLKGKPVRSWIRELQVMWRDETGAQHSAFFKARDGKEQGRGSSGFIDRLELDGSPVAPPLSEGSSVVGSGGFKLLLAETKSCKGKDEDEFHLTIDGLVDMGISARLAHPLMQTASEAQAHFNVHIARLNHTSGIHGVLGQTFREEESRKVRSLRYRLLTRLLREPVEVESESGRGFLDGRTEDYITSDIHSADCMYAAAWRRGEHESSEGSDFM